MSARLLSVNVAVPGTLRSRGRDIPTGIFKRPVEGRVRLGKLGLQGDIQADRRYHGGPEQAVYAYSSEHSAHWEPELARPGGCPPGFFGENFTTEAFVEKDVAVGDVYRVGTAAVQVTRPRAPCFRLGLRVGAAGFVRSFLESGRLGFYLSVPEPGEVSSGDPMERIHRPNSALIVSELIRLLYFDPDDADGLERAARAGGLPGSVRQRLEESLSRARNRLF